MQQYPSRECAMPAGAGPSSPGVVGAGGRGAPLRGVGASD